MTFFRCFSLAKRVLRELILLDCVPSVRLFGRASLIDVGFNMYGRGIHSGSETNINSVVCRGDALHEVPSDTLFELAWIWLCRGEAGAVEGFGGRARRVPRSLACCGMCGVCIMTAAAVDSSSICRSCIAVLAYHVAVGTSQEGRECNKE